VPSHLGAFDYISRCAGRVLTFPPLTLAEQSLEQIVRLVWISLDQFFEEGIAFFAGTFEGSFETLRPRRLVRVPLDVRGYASAKLAASIAFRSASPSKVIGQTTYAADLCYDRLSKCTTVAHAVDFTQNSSTSTLGRIRPLG
jgi:hypothetical protein